MSKAASDLNLYVVGVRSVAEVLTHRAGNVSELFLLDQKGKSQIAELAQSQKIPVSSVEDRFFQEIAPGVTHQGVALKLKERQHQGLKEFVTKVEKLSNSIVVAVDEVFDPQNLGSILRASECFGVSGLLWSKNRGASVTPAVTKVSVGASELVPLVPVSNLRSALLELKKAGFWICVSNVSDSSESLHTFEFPERTVLVLGSEGKGVQPLVQKEADFQLHIPMLGHIDSLNVSQATAVFLAGYRARHLKR